MRFLLLLVCSFRYPPDKLLKCYFDFDILIPLRELDRIFSGLSLIDFRYFLILLTEALAGSLLIGILSYLVLDRGISFAESSSSKL